MAQDPGSGIFPNGYGYQAQLPQNNMLVSPGFPGAYPSFYPMSSPDSSSITALSNALAQLSLLLNTISIYQGPFGNYSQAYSPNFLAAAGNSPSTMANLPSQLPNSNCFLPAAPVMPAYRGPFGNYSQAYSPNFLAAAGNFSSTMANLSSQLPNSNCFLPAAPVSSASPPPPSTNVESVYTALHIAAWNGDLEEVKRLVESGEDINRRDNREGYSAFEKAVYRGHFEIVKYFLTEQKKQGIVLSGNKGIRPIQYESCSKNPLMLQLLVDAHIKSGDKNFFGLDLQNIDFKGKDLRGSNFTNANLSGVDLSKTILGGVKFGGANLTNVNLNQAILEGLEIWSAKNIVGLKMDLMEVEEEDNVKWLDPDPSIVFDHERINKFIGMAINVKCHSLNARKCEQALVADFFELRRILYRRNRQPFSVSLKEWHTAKNIANSNTVNLAAFYAQDPFKKEINEYAERLGEISEFYSHARQLQPRIVSSSYLPSRQ
jgi:hypothetical protein